LGPIKDVEDNQIGDADYVYTREEALLEAAQSSERR